MIILAKIFHNCKIALGKMKSKALKMLKGKGMCGVFIYHLCFVNFLQTGLIKSVVNSKKSAKKLKEYQKNLSSLVPVKSIKSLNLPLQ
jgi:hypothetical protein